MFTIRRNKEHFFSAQKVSVVISGKGSIKATDCNDNVLLEESDRPVTDGVEYYVCVKCRGGDDFISVGFPITSWTDNNPYWYGIFD